jgi:hypothetical protein
MPGLVFNIFIVFALVKNYMKQNLSKKAHFTNLFLLLSKILGVFKNPNPEIPRWQLEGGSRKHAS